MRLWPSVAISLALVALLACEKAPPAPPEPDPEPPAALLGYAELPSATDVSDLADAVGQIAPEGRSAVSTMLPMQLGKLMTAHIASSDAVDLSGPVRLLVLDPEQHPEPLVLLVRAKAEAKIEPAQGSKVVRIGDHAAVGAEKAVAAVEGFAAHLATVPVAEARAVAFPGHVLAAFRDELGQLSELARSATPEETGGVDFEQIFAAYAEIIEVIGAQSDTAILSVSSQPGVAQLDLEIEARPGSQLAAFFAAQKPATFTLHQRLPAFGDASFVAEWALHAGPALPAMMSFGERLFGAAMQDQAQAMSQWLRRYAKLLTGTGAMAMQIAPAAGTAQPQARGVAVYGVNDEAGAREATVEGLTLWSGKRAIMGMETESEFEAEAATHAGVPIARQRGVTRMPGAAGQAPVELEQLSHFAAAGGLLVYAMGPDSEAQVRGAIDLAQGRGQAFEPGAVAQRAIELAQRSKASALMFMDLKSFVPASGTGPVPSFAMLLAFSDASATFTMSVLR